ncbi:MAG TPA: hypothetical protein VI479_21500, partial [Blastocatellia bacterium]
MITSNKSENRYQTPTSENQSAIRNPQSAIEESAIRNPQSAIPMMIVAGEASGDKHGAKLVSALRALRPNLSFEIFGAGG